MTQDRQAALERVADECLRLAPRSRWQAVALLRKRVGANRDLRHALFDRYLDAMLGLLLEERSGEARHDTTLAGHLAAKGQTLAAQAGQNDVVNHMTNAPVSSKIGGGGQRPCGTQTTNAPSPTRLFQPTKPPRVSLSALARAGAAAAGSLLDDFRVDNRPIGDLTGGEARSAARRMSRDSLFVSFLATGVPDDLPIRRARSPEEAKAEWARAIRVAASGATNAAPALDPPSPPTKEAHPHA